MNIMDFIGVVGLCLNFFSCRLYVWKERKKITAPATNLAIIF